MHFPTLSVLSSLCLLNHVSALAVPRTEPVAKRATSITYPLGGLNIFASPTGAPFASLGNVNFDLQYTDSNLVIYVGGVASWYTGFGAKPISCAAPNTCELVFQYDGNLVKYINGKPVWESYTNGIGHTLVLRDTMPYLQVVGANGLEVFSTPFPGEHNGSGCVFNPAYPSDCMGYDQGMISHLGPLP
jgi:hypothetical protein